MLCDVHPTTNDFIDDKFSGASSSPSNTSSHSGAILAPEFTEKTSGTPEGRDPKIDNDVAMVEADEGEGAGGAAAPAASPLDMLAGAVLASEAKEEPPSTAVEEGKGEGASPVEGGDTEMGEADGEANGEGDGGEGGEKGNGEKGEGESGEKDEPMETEEAKGEPSGEGEPDKAESDKAGSDKEEADKVEPMEEEEESGKGEPSKDEPEKAAPAKEEAGSDGGEAKSDNENGEEKPAEAEAEAEEKKPSDDEAKEPSNGEAKEKEGEGEPKSEDAAKGEEKSEAKDEGEDAGKSDTKKESSAEDDEKKAPSPEANLPLLVGTLAYSDRDNQRRHIVRGNWRYPNSHAMPPQRFELLRTIPADETLEDLPANGEFNGSFNVQHHVKTAKGKVKLKTRVVPESGVKLTFSRAEDEEGGEGNFTVKGTGTNEYGVFELFGTATREAPDEGMDEEEDEDGAAATPVTYGISLHKKYVAIAPAPSAETKKDKKRKLEEDEEAKPPPTELPSEGICLRGKLVRNTSDELSLDNTAVHRITGLWAMKGLSKILEAPGECEKFEYEHKCSGDSTVFPLSGRYTGFFYVSEMGSKTKIAERDVTLKFRQNNAGYHNVEGKGSNLYGKYSITGTLDKDGAITLFRHFQAPKAAKKKSTSVRIAAPPKSAKAAAAAPATTLTFDDVSVPESAEKLPPPLTPPEQFTATSRGILKMEADGTHTCSGSWAMSNEQFQGGITSKYHFGVQAQYAAEDARAMLDKMAADGTDEDDTRVVERAGDGSSPVTLANSTFPIDSTHYKGSFKLRKGTTKFQTIVDRQIVLKFVKNSGGSYNVHGKGTNEMGTFDLVGTLILQGKSNGLMQLYRLYPQPPAPVALPPSKKSGKTFSGGLTEKAVNSGPVPAMKPPERFVPSMSGLQRQSSRMVRLPSRLEEDDPQAIMDRLMDRCRQILKELMDADVQRIFAAPVDPIALGIPQYLDIIKDPMDLGTVQKRMEGGDIDSPAEFKRLVELTFKNAVTFNNMPDNPVNQAARLLLGTFHKKFGNIDKQYADAKSNKKLTKAEKQELKRKEKEAAKEAKRRAKEEKERKRKAEAEAAKESKRMKLESVESANRQMMKAIAAAKPEESGAPVTRIEFDLMIQAIKQQQDQIVALHKMHQKSSKPSSSSAAPKASTYTYYDDAVDASSAYAPSFAADDDEPEWEPPKPKKKKAKRESPVYKPTPPPTPDAVEDLQPLSFEEQEALSEAINLLPEHLLPGAMQIIRESDLVNDDDDEIDLDIDQLDTRTQRKLQSFVMQNVKTKKKKKAKKSKQASAPAPAAAAPSPPAEETKASNSRLPGGKSFFALGDDDDSDDDKDDDEEDIKADFATNWVANPTDPAAEKGTGNGDSNKDDEDDLWGAARKEAEASKVLEADRAKREEKMKAEAEKASEKRMAEAAALGEKARAEREEKEAEEARLREEQEQEAEEARNAAREKAIQEVNSEKATVDIGDAQRELMKQYEQEFNDNYSAGASPSSDFGF
ncbi:hypothetical protein ACHAXT_008310 [Thalassiosira profunda]